MRPSRAWLHRKSRLNQISCRSIQTTNLTVLKSQSKSVEHATVNVCRNFRSVPWLLRYFRLNSSGLNGKQTDRTTPGATLLAPLKIDETNLWFFEIPTVTSLQNTHIRRVRTAKDADVLFLFLLLSLFQLNFQSNVLCWQQSFRTSEPNNQS